MTRLKIAWMVFAAGFGLLCGGSAFAGPLPIRWEYSASFSAGDSPWGGSVISLGAISIHEVVLGQLQASAPGSAWGWKTVNLGSISKFWSVTPDMDFGPWGFQLNLDITDAASGETGRLMFRGDAGAGAQLEDWWSPFTGSHLHVTQFGVYAWNLSDADQTLALGGNDYHVHLRARNGDWASLDAEVTVGTENRTPEPTSLALAATGLAGGVIAARRRMRRRGCAI